VTYASSGDRGVSVRVLPYHKYMRTPLQTRLITWA
jgi:hypothetical protein